MVRIRGPALGTCLKWLGQVRAVVGKEESSLSAQGRYMLVPSCGGGNGRIHTCVLAPVPCLLLRRAGRWTANRVQSLRAPPCPQLPNVNHPLLWRKGWICSVASKPMQLNCYLAVFTAAPGHTGGRGKRAWHWWKCRGNVAICFPPPQLLFLIPLLLTERNLCG